MKFALISRVVSLASIVLMATAMFALPTAGRQRDKPKLAKPGDPSQDQKSKDDQDVQRLSTDLVLLDVTVVDQNNRPVMDLGKEQFDVLEDKIPQKIEFFSREQAPVSLVFVIDASGSMRPKLDTVIKASVNLVKESKAGDEMAVIQFKDQPELLEEFTSDINDVTDALQGIIASRQTAMLDALYLSADYASKEGKNRKKAVILVTDGLDNNSYYKFDEVVSHLRETDTQIYFIGFISDLSADHGLFNRSEKDKAENLLNKLAADTGGKAFYPRELADVHSIAQQISTDLRTQYSIGYYPTNSKRDGTFRAVKIGITGGGNRRLVARTRSGYTAPKETDRRSASN
jgi:Ca-activated chloride channel family protein